MMSARNERIRAFGGRRGRSPPSDLVFEHLFGKPSGFVLGDYLPRALGASGFGLLGYPFGLLRASYGFSRVGGWACLLEGLGALFWVFDIEET